MLFRVENILQIFKLKTEMHSSLPSAASPRLVASNKATSGLNFKR